MERENRFVNEGHEDAVDDEAGAVLDDAGLFPHLLRETERGVHSLLGRPRTISTGGMIGTGLKKCMPTTFSGRPVAAASRVMEMLDVFVARITCGAHFRSSCRRMSVLIDSLSGTASMTNSAAAAAAS